MKIFFIVIVFLIAGAHIAYSQAVFIRAFGTVIPFTEHVPISIYDDYGLARYEDQGAIGFGAGSEIEVVLPLNTELGVSLFAGAKYLFERDIIGLAYSLLPIYGGAKASLRITRDYPWSVYILTRLGYSILLPGANYQERVLDFRDLTTSGGIYFNAGIGSEILIGGPVSFITEATFDMSLIDTVPEYTVLGDVKHIEDYRIEILAGVSIHLQ